MKLLMIKMNYNQGQKFQVSKLFSYCYNKNMLKNWVKGVIRHFVLIVENSIQGLNEKRNLSNFLHV